MHLYIITDVGLEKIMDSIKKVDDSEFRIIDILDNNNNLTQRHIAQKAGISLGMTNLIIRKLVKKGFIKIKNMDKKRILYHLTPKALIDKSTRTYHYFEKTVKDIVYIREKIQEEIVKRNGQNVKEIIILGKNELSEIARWAIQNMKLNYTTVDDLSLKDINKYNNQVIINCGKEIIKKDNVINIYKIL